MFIYIGVGGNRKHLKVLRDTGWGRMISASDFRSPAYGISWALDNGAWNCYTRGVPFDEDRFLKVLGRIPPGMEPDFAIIPDLVGGGLASIEMSKGWIPRLPRRWPWYLVVSGGVEVQDVLPLLEAVDGIFVGMPMDWKIRTGRTWVELAHDHGLKCHIGAVGTHRRMIWANRIGADSIDSTTIVQSRNWKKKFRKLDLVAGTIPLSV